MTEHAIRYNERMISRDLAIMMTLPGTGMRISELVGLNVSDIDKTDEKSATCVLSEKVTTRIKYVLLILYLMR